MTTERLPVLAVFVAACLLGAPLQAGATVIVTSNVSFSNLVITSAAGTFSFDAPGQWILEAFAHADNSLGGSSDDFSTSTSPDSVSASAATTWASANGAASAPNASDFAVGGTANAAINISSGGPAAAFSKGRGTLFNFFTLSGGGSSVAVQFSVDISGMISATTAGNGISAASETVFHLDVDGAPVLFNDQILSIGPNDSQTLSLLTTLTTTLMLDSDVSHFLAIEVETDPQGHVSEPPVGVLMLAALMALTLARRHPLRARAA